MCKDKDVNGDAGRNSRQDEQDGQDTGMEDQELQKVLAKMCRLFVSVPEIQIGEAVWL